VDIPPFIDPLIDQREGRLMGRQGSENDENCEKNGSLGHQELLSRPG
jgi:hypothetical protein